MYRDNSERNNSGLYECRIKQVLLEYEMIVVILLAIGMGLKLIGYVQKMHLFTKID